MASPTIKQKVEFNSSASKIFELLTTAKVFESATGAPAKMDPVAGGEFDLFGGWILGSNIELVAGKRVVQNWRAKNWPEGIMSKVTFELSESNGKTTLDFTHDGYPDGEGEHLAQGWEMKYWAPFREFLNK
jgi:activator of HSP90 ATPase